MASNLWQMFIAMTDEGFSEEQALMLIGQMFKRPQRQRVTRLLDR